MDVSFSEKKRERINLLNLIVAFRKCIYWTCCSLCKLFLIPLYLAIYINYDLWAISLIPKEISSIILVTVITAIIITTKWISLTLILYIGMHCSDSKDIANNFLLIENTDCKSISFERCLWLSWVYF